MTVYIVFIILTLLGIVLCDCKQTNGTGEKAFYWLLCIGLILISGLSRELGGDKQLYLAFFDEIDLSIPLGEYITEQFEEYSFMPLWSILNYISCDWFNSFTLVQIVQAIIINTTACYIAYKYTNCHFLFLFLFFISGIFFQFNTEVMREGGAIGLGLIAMDSFLDKKIGKYIVFVVLALLFHISALILLLFPILTITRWIFNWKMLWICLIVSFFMWFISDVILTSIFPKLTFLPSELIHKIAHYTNEGASLGGYIGLTIRYIIVPFIIGYFVFNAETNTDMATKKKQYIIYQLAIGTIICSTGWSFIRFANYSCIFYIIWITTLVELLVTQRKHILAQVFCLLFVCGFQLQRFLIYYPETNAYFYEFFVPYTSIFDNTQPRIDRLELYQEACPPKDNIAARNIYE
ncbi:MAG: EpsG family protein [Paludibacteraceae bacterium]|nr:EpsG family protein [Paludibacteraceae bacterium]